MIGDRNCCRSSREGPLEWSNRRFGAKSAQICGKKVTLDQKSEKRAKILRSGQKLCVAGMNRGRKWVPPMRLHTLQIIAYTFHASKRTPSPSKNSLRAQKTTFPANSPRGGGELMHKTRISAESTPVVLQIIPYAWTRYEHSFTDFLDIYPYRGRGLGSELLGGEMWPK